MEARLAESFGRAGFANRTYGKQKLLPCSVGTFVNSSVSDPNELKCVECPAGTFCIEYLKKYQLTKIFTFPLPAKKSIWRVYCITAGLKCRSQVTGQVTGYRSQVRSQVTGHRPQVRLQATGHRSGYRSQVTGQVTGHRSGHRSQKNNRTLDKTVLDWRFTLQKSNKPRNLDDIFVL